MLHNLHWMELALHCWNIQSSSLEQIYVSQKVFEFSHNALLQIDLLYVEAFLSTIWVIRGKLNLFEHNVFYHAYMIFKIMLNFD